MSVVNEAYFISIWLEGFLYGKRCALTCPLAKEVPDLGLYSGIFAMYLQCPSKKSRTAIILFYPVCLLYILSTATFAGDLAALIFYASNNPISEISFLYISCAVTSLDTAAST